MARHTICSSCEMGDHKGHRGTVQAAPEGGVGGSVCTCDGECKDGRYKRSFGELLGLTGPTLDAFMRKITS